jgi:hypothetical protein
LPGGVSMGLADSPDVVAKFSRKYVKPLIFNAAFLYVITVISAAELVIREQDWSSVNVGADNVYPVYLYIYNIYVYAYMFIYIHIYVYKCMLV